MEVSYKASSGNLVCEILNTFVGIIKGRIVKKIRKIPVANCRIRIRKDRPPK